MRKQISSKDNPRYKAAIKLKESRTRKREGLFLAEGLREIDRAQNSCELDAIWLCPDLQKTLDPEAESLLQACQSPIFELPTHLFEKLAYRENPEGVVGVFKTPPAFTLDDLKARLAEPPRHLSRHLLLVTVGIEKPGNLGAMMRSAAAAGATALINLDQTIDLYNPNCVRSSTGAVFDMCALSLPESDWQTFARANAIAHYPAMISGDSVNLFDLELAGEAAAPLAIVIGPEDTGLDERWNGYARETEGQSLIIPMARTCVDSLNAANAASVFLFVFSRQLST